MSNLPSFGSPGESHEARPHPLTGPRSTETSYFPVAMKTDCFVDKTLMIEKVLGESENLLITCPRKFGKSTNLDMLRRFFDVAEENRSIFANLKINDRPDIMEKHCGNYAVLWIDFSWFTVTIDSEAMVGTAIREILHRVFLQYAFLRTSSKLTEHERKLCEDLCDSKRCLELNELTIARGFLDLPRYLHEHYEKDVIILVDEFDAIHSKAMLQVDELELDAIIRYYFRIFAIIVKTEKSSGRPFVFKAIFTGITSVPCYNPCPLNNIQRYQFLENTQFADYYGILESEFDILLKKPEFSKLHDQRNDAMMFYNGYKFENRKILNTYSVVNYLLDNSVHPSEPLEPYWCHSVAVPGFSDVWEREEMQPLLQNIILGKGVGVETICILPHHLITLRRIFTVANQSISNDINILLIYLQRLGYFQIESTEMTGSHVRIPNEEIRSVFKSVLGTYFQRKYHFEDVTLRVCAQHFDRLVDVPDGDEIKETFQRIKEQLTKACNESLACQFLNEDTPKHLVFAVLLKTIFQPISQVCVEELLDNRGGETLDLCFFKKDLAVIVENKFGAKETAETALISIKATEYYDIFLSGKIEGIKEYCFVGIHLNETGQIGLAYAINDINMCNIVVV